MTYVYCEKDGDRYTVTAQGHATGSTEVCAAVSGLLYALAGYLNNEQGIGALHGRVLHGDFSVVFCGDERAEAVYSMTVIGLLQIEKSHPEYIRVEQEEIS